MQIAPRDTPKKTSSKRFAFDLFLQLTYSQPDEQGDYGYRDAGNQIRIDTQT